MPLGTELLWSVGARWQPLVRQRANVRGKRTYILRSVGARWHPLARQRAQTTGNNAIIAIRWRSPRLVFIIINVSGVGARGRAWVLPSIVALAQPHLGLNVAHVLLVAPS